MEATDPPVAPPRRRRRKSRRGSGELIKESSGIWYARYYDGDGKRRNRSTETTSKPDAERFLAEKVAEASKVRSGRARSDRGGNILAGELLPKWLEGLTNRDTKNDKSRAERYLAPKWGRVKMRNIDLAAILEWLDELRRSPAPPSATKRGRRPAGDHLAEPTIRHLLNLLSRFFAWAVERGHATHNPVRDVPSHRRPLTSGRTDAPWLDDDAAVRTLVHGLPTPIGLMFYLGNRSGLRTGEICGLRLSDLAGLDEGSIRVRFSYRGPLKEDKKREGKMKWAPAPADAAALLEPVLVARRAQGANAEDPVFVTESGGMFTALAVGRAWNEATGRRPPRNKKKAPTDAAPSPLAALTWYMATRHSFVTRNLSRDAALEEVSSAIGHANPATTKRYYDHFVRKTFSEGLRQGLGLTPAAGGSDAPVLPLHAPAKGGNRTKNGTTSEQKGAKRERRKG